MLIHSIPFTGKNIQKELSSIQHNYLLELSKKKFVTGTNSANNGTSTIYTTPSATFFFLSGMTFQQSNNSLTFGNSGEVQINGNTFTRAYGNANAGAQIASLVFTIPIILGEGETIKVTNTSVDLRTTGTIYGYEVSASDIFIKKFYQTIFL